MPQMTVHLKGYAHSDPPTQADSERVRPASQPLNHAHTHIFLTLDYYSENVPQIYKSGVLNGVWFVAGKSGEQSGMPPTREGPNKDRISHTTLKPTENDGVDVFCSNLKDASWSIVR